MRRLSRLTLSCLVLTPLCLTAQTQDPQSNKPRTEKPVPANKGIDFRKQVLPILQKNCIECHQAAHVDENGKRRRPKGRVELDSVAGIKKSKRGKVVVPSKPALSKMITAASLPADDEDRMPPAKFGPPLSKKDLETLTKWIEQGANYGTWQGIREDAEAKKGGKKDGKGKTEKPKGKAEKSGNDDLEELATGLAQPDADLLASLAKVHAQASPITIDSPLLRVTFYGREDDVSDATLHALLPAREHILELVLARTNVTDAGLKTLLKMPRLRHLDLRQTQIGDRGAQTLAALGELRTLNLFGTEVGDNGLRALAACTALERVVAWQSRVTEDAVVALRAQRPDTRITFQPTLPAAAASDTPSRNRGRRRR